MRDISGLKINEDAVIVGIAASGLWIHTTRFSRLRMAWTLLTIAWRTLRGNGRICPHCFREVWRSKYHAHCESEHGVEVIRP